MSANRLFLVCSLHPSIEDALLIADRHDAQARYYCESNCRCVGCKCAEKSRARRNAWFEKHSKCGNPDDFKLALHRQPNWDVPKPQLEPVAAGVKLAIVDSQLKGPGSYQDQHPEQMSNLNGGKPQ